MTKPEIQSRIATRLKVMRTEKGLSLDALAQLSGVSRSMVSQIERGESSPTVATLWNITQALGIDIGGLLDDREAPAIAVIRADAAPLIEGLGKDCTIRILSPPEEVGRHEVYELTFAAGGVLDSDPHSPGTREHLTVIKGQIALGAADSTDLLGQGDSARYPADGPHTLAAHNGDAKALLIVQFT
ncbi:MAG: helix-turn-helix domain-containing protein [Boseongicola sp.]|nr:MAG: helix-turn-helix domain-containing protein [Boseongicola sp.]